MESQNFLTARNKAPQNHASCWWTIVHQLNPRLDTTRVSNQGDWSFLWVFEKCKKSLNYQRTVIGKTLVYKILPCPWRTCWDPFSPIRPKEAGRNRYASSKSSPIPRAGNETVTNGLMDGQFVDKEKQNNGNTKLLQKLQRMSSLELYKISKICSQANSDHCLFRKVKGKTSKEHKQNFGCSRFIFSVCESIQTVNFVFRKSK